MSESQRKACIKIERRSINNGAHTLIGQLVIWNLLGDRDVYGLSGPAIERAMRYARKNHTTELPAEEAEAMLDGDCWLAATLH